MATVTPNLVYDTADLISVVPNLKLPVTFLLDRYFPNITTSDTEFVAIDVEIGKRRMSPFVSPKVEGKLVEQLRYQTNVFKPPYIKDKRAPDLFKPVKRMVGERLTGALKGEEREMINLAAEMQDQVNMLTRRLEWMAASALTVGTVTVVGDGFPTQVIDFGRDPSLTLALTGGAAWTPQNVVTPAGAPGTASPSQNIEVWQRNILKQSGARVVDLVFSTSAWDGFIADPVLKALIYYPKLSDFGNAINPGAQIAPGAVYKGRYGQYDLWLYNEWAVDENNVERPMLPDGMMLLAGPDILGTRSFAQIIDPRFNYNSMPFAPKVWIEEDPGQRFIMMQSAPIVIPTRANAAMAVQVCPPLYN